MFGIIFAVKKKKEIQNWPDFTSATGLVIKIVFAGSLFLSISHLWALIQICVWSFVEQTNFLD